MTRARAWAIAATSLLLPATAFGQSASTHKPLTGVRSRGAQVLAPGQAAASDTAADGAVAPPGRPVFMVVPVAHPIVQACDRPFPKTNITLGSRSFDRRLADALKGGAPVLVDVADPYDPAGEPPPALSPWLSAAKAGGGAVTVTPYCTGGRGIVRDWVEDVVGRISGRIYRPARNYDVVIYADAARRKVTQVQFRPKSSTASSTVATN